MLKKTILVVLMTALLASAFPYADPPQTRKGRFWYFVDNLEVTGDNPYLLIWVTRPVSQRYQDIVTGDISPEPYSVLADEFGTNEYILWRVTDFGENPGPVFYYDFDCTPFEIVTDIDVDTVEPYDVSSPEYIRYTQSEPWVEITNDICAKSYEIVGTETNPYLKAKLIYDWVISNMSYEYPDVNNRGAEKSFARLKGDCGEFSVVFAALCRAQGIPARTVTCVWFTEAGHQWAEIFIPPYGWIPVDTSVGDVIAGNNPSFADPARRDSFKEMTGLVSDDPDYLFGNLYPNRMVVSVGNNHKLIYPELGIEKEFRFMQPGGEFAYPTAIEWEGLSDKTVYAGFYIYGDDCDNIDTARKKAKSRMAFGYLNAEEYDKAIEGFLVSLEEKPEDTMALLNLGQAYQGKGEIDAAIDAYTRSLAGKGGSMKPILDVWSHNLLGECFALKGDEEKARTEFQTVIDSGIDFNDSRDFALRRLEALDDPETGDGK